MTELLSLGGLKAVERVCASRLSDPTEFGDAVSETLFRAWRSIGTLKATELPEFEGWLTTIAKRAVSRVVAQRMRRENVILLADPAPNGRLDQCSVDDSHTSDFADLTAALEKIKPEYREALLLYVFVGLSYQEIADVQVVALNTVKSRIRRSRTALAVLLKVEPDV